MNITILNGALAGDVFADRLVDELATEYEGVGCKVIAWRLREHKAAYCLGCFECWTHTPGQCRVDDDMRAVTASIIQCDLAVIVSPVTFQRLLKYNHRLIRTVHHNVSLERPFPS